MKEIIQLYTDTIKGNFYNSRNLLFISEGYRAVDEALFYKDVFHLLERLEGTFPTLSFSYKTIELWEDGGGYRKKIYRAAHDCLLRRRIGDTTLPVKTKRVSLCPICELTLNKLF